MFFKGGSDPIQFCMLSFSKVSFARGPFWVVPFFLADPSEVVAFTSTPENMDGALRRRGRPRVVEPLEKWPEEVAESRRVAAQQRNAQRRRAKGNCMFSRKHQRFWYKLWPRLFTMCIFFDLALVYLWNTFRCLETVYLGFLCFKRSGRPLGADMARLGLQSFKHQRFWYYCKEKSPAYSCHCGCL